MNCVTQLQTVFLLVLLDCLKQNFRLNIAQIEVYDGTCDLRPHSIIVLLMTMSIAVVEGNFVLHT